MKLINVSHVKEVALKIEASRFPNYPRAARTRVSKEFLNDCESALMNFIQERVRNNSMGKGGKTI